MITAEVALPDNLRPRVDDRLRDLMRLNGNRVPEEMKLMVTASYEFRKDKDQKILGLTHRHGMVIRVGYTSPFKGLILPGDLILKVNGTDMAFEERSSEDKTTAPSTQNSKMKLARKKPAAPVTPKASLVGSKEFKEFVQKLFATKEEIVRVDVTVARLRTRTKKFRVPRELERAANSSYEEAIIFQYKFLKLGLNMQQIGPKVVVNYTLPDSVSHGALNIGETISMINEKAVNSLEEVKVGIVNGIKHEGFARLIVEIPVTDPLRNQIRNQLATAAKETERPSYAQFEDVKKFVEEGIDALKNAKEPSGIWKETKESERKEVEKKKSTRKADQKEGVVAFNEKTEEHGIPSEWNTQLFVKMLPPKTKQTEMTTGNTLIVPLPKKGT
ncbi:unnamed protein product [Caenorhabditis sp. 36 PRJEB53466]|nr:unnamed protein product [Caenorhabditis sp. 36 PRJEB53466]